MSLLQQFVILTLVFLGCLTERCVVDGGRILSTSSIVTVTNNNNVTAQFRTGSHSTNVRRVGAQNLVATNGSCGVQQQTKVAVVRTIADVYRGASACISTHQPKVGKDEYSSARISIKSASSNSGEVEHIEVGLMVNPSVNGDDSTRAYIKWTGKDLCSGCYNLDCPGFVKTNKAFSIVNIIPTHMSLEDDQQYCMFFEISMDEETGDWWFTVTDENTRMGYLPSELFGKLGNKGEGTRSIIEWGGEVSYPKDSISPQMGSSHLPVDGFGKAAFFQQLNFTNVDFDKKSVADNLAVVSQYSDSNGCYGIGNSMDDSDWGYNFFYGGPGFC